MKQYDTNLIIGGATDTVMHKQIEWTTSVFDLNTLFLSGSVQKPLAGS